MGIFGPGRDKQTRSTNRALAVGSELGIAVLIGLFGGNWLDERLGTVPWFMIVGLLLGGAAGVRSLMRLAPKPKQPPREERTSTAMKQIDRITTYVAALGVLLSALAFAISVEVGLGALVGAAIAIADWLVTRFLGARILAAGERGRTFLSLALVSKMTLVLGACAAVLWSERVSPLGFMIGISAMFVGVVVGGLRSTLSAADPATDAAQPSESK